MYGNYNYAPNINLERLNRQRDEIDNLIKSCQANQQPINNIITTQQTPTDLYELKILNDGDEAENIFISSNTIFMGNNRMQIKKMDGTIEKYNVDKYYPIDEKDEKIKELNKKVEELERRLNNEYSKSNEPTREFNKSNANDDGNVESKSKTTSKSISKQN